MSGHEMQVIGRKAECNCGWWISDLTNAWAVSSAAAHMDAVVDREMATGDANLSIGSGVATRRPTTDEQGPGGTSGHRHDGDAYKATEGDE